MGYLILGIIVLTAILIFGGYSSVCYECCNVDGRFYEMGR